MIRKMYPGGKARVFTFSYDDGVLQDARFVALLNRYGLKGTFNLNYGLMHRDFTWAHDCGMTIRRLPPWRVLEVYRGHEVASHSFTHTYFDNLNEVDILKELASDKFLLEKLFGREISGYATPFTFYSDLIEDCVKHCGFAYARISEESNDYSVPENFHRWRGSKFHWDEDLEEFVSGFLKSGQELAMCQIVGHSYDLDVMDLWEKMERICKNVSEAHDVWAATHMDLVRYLEQMKKARISDREIQNESSAALWFRVKGKPVKLLPGETITL